MNQNINKIEKDIKSIKIQGATNVAIATLKGMKLAVQHISADTRKIIKLVKEVGEKLSLARENEPLARNGVKYVLSSIKGYKRGDLTRQIVNLCDSYQVMIRNAKKEIIKYGTELLRNEKVVLTHCHSSTAVAILKNVAKYRKINKKEFKVISTETRPLYQGRVTAKELFDSDVDVTQIVDSVCASFIVEDKYIPVGSVVVGCDELLVDGSFINKVGTYAIALASEKDKDKFYIATSLLKLDPLKNISRVKIEQRESSEVWSDAPKGINIINPAFERVNSSYVTSYITEAGVLTKSDLFKITKRIYPWLFDDL